MLQCPQSTIAVFGHADFFNCFLERQCGQPDVWLDNAQVYKIDFPRRPESAPPYPYGPHSTSPPPPGYGYHPQYHQGPAPSAVTGAITYHYGGEADVPTATYSSPDAKARKHVPFVYERAPDVRVKKTPAPSATAWNHRVMEAPTYVPTSPQRVVRSAPIDEATTYVPTSPQRVVRSAPIDEAIKNTFDRFDTNRSGRLDYRELRNCLNALGIDVTGREAAEVLTSYDADGNGLMEL